MNRWGMDTKESDLVEKYGISRAEFKDIRKTIKQNGELGRLWYRADGKKPEHLRTVFWTDVGQYFLAHYLQSKVEFIQQEEQSIESVMTKGQFDKLVNNSKWVGKVTRNSYANTRLVTVEHETGFKVNVACKDNKLYSKHSYVQVDTKSLKHTIRLPSFKNYEKAKESLKPKR
jgi:hypothetical protein